MKLRTDEIASVIREEIEQYRRDLDVVRVGKVLEVGDGIAQIYGLWDAMAGEMLAFEDGSMGQVFNLEQNSIGAVIYGSTDAIKAGHTVRSTRSLLEVPVGDEILGRVVDPLGNPLDGGDEIATGLQRPLECPAPGIADRQPVFEPLQTGLKSVDAMIPIGRGQRELIIGDRKTGKTAIAIDAIINQRATDMLCVYVAIGQKESTVAGVVDTLRKHNAMDHTVVVSASSSDPAPLQYIAPYAGCTIAEHFMVTRGKHVLVVYDDLTKQAAAYRQISLLLRRPPGREAYPGDVFYLHSRLLERSAKLAHKYVIAPSSTPADATDVRGVDEQVYVGPLGAQRAQRRIESMGEGQDLKLHRLPDSGGSLTALPICETQEGEVSSYIPTNLIGITDGQIYLEPGLFFAGVRPAINVGISVSRVGYKAAMPAMKTVAASLRLDLAAYRERQAFAQLGMELDKTTQKQLARGERMVRLLTQPQYQPMDVLEQVISIFAGTKGYLDDLDLDEVPQFEAGLIRYMHSVGEDWMDEVREDYQLSRERQKRLAFLIEQYKDTAWKEARRARQEAEAAGQDDAADQAPADSDQPAPTGGDFEE
jgi:F-type H+-transporting ATPase subunit alpha